MWNVYEYPFTGIAIAIIAAIGIWIYGLFRPERKRRVHYLIPLLIIIASAAVAYFVQTDREKILGAINKGIKAFEKQKIEPIREIIANDYSDVEHTSKELIIAYCQAMMQTAMVERVTFLSRETAIEGNKATFTAEMMVKFSEESEISKMGKPFLIVKARFHFEKTADKKWLINSSEILELDRKAVNWGEIRG